MDSPATKIITNIGGKIAVSATILTGLFFGTRYFLDKNKRLQKQKVKINWDNIPHYSINTVKRYAELARDGKLYSWGSSWNAPIKAYNYMVTNKKKNIYWSPDKLITELYSAMKGVNFPTTVVAVATAALSPISFLTNVLFQKQTYTDPRTKAWNKVLKLNKEQLRLLHNKWIETSAEGSSFFDWVNGEWGDSDIQKQILSKLNIAGVGENVIKQKQ